MAHIDVYSITISALLETDMDHAFRLHKPNKKALHMLESLFSASLYTLYLGYDKLCHRMREILEVKRTWQVMGGFNTE